MTYAQISNCRDLAKLKAARNTIHPRLYGKHGAALTEAQNKYQAIVERIHELKGNPKDAGR